MSSTNLIGDLIQETVEEVFERVDSDDIDGLEVEEKVAPEEIGDVKEECDLVPVLATGCHGDQATVLPECHDNCCGDASNLLEDSSDSEDIGQLYRAQDDFTVEEIFTPLPLETISTISMVGDDASRLVSRIPRARDSSLPTSLKRCPGLSLSKLSLSWRDQAVLKPSLSKQSYSSRKPFSPRTSVRGLETELKLLKRKYVEAKADFDVKEKNIGKMKGQILNLINQISEVSGKERTLDEDLKGLRTFAMLQNMKKNLNVEVDMSLHLTSLAEIDKLWEDLISGILGYRNGTIKWLETKKVCDNKSNFAPETEVICKMVDSAKDSVAERKRVFLEKVECLLKDSSQHRKSLELQCGMYENAIEGHETYVATLKKNFADSKHEQEKVLNKQKDLNIRRGIEIVSKNKEIETLKEEILRVQNLNKTLTINTANKERDHKENIAMLKKQYEEISRKEKEWQQKYEEIRLKLGSLQSREDNLKKKLFPTDHPKGNVTSKTDMTKPTETAPAAPDSGRKERKPVKAKAGKGDRAEAPPISSEQTESASGPTEEQMMQLQQKIDQQQCEIQALQASMEEANLDIKQKVEDVMAWEQELTLRENRLHCQQDVARMRNDLLKLLNRREVRRAHPHPMSYEAVVGLLKERSDEVKLLKKQDERSRIQKDMLNLNREHRGRCSSQDSKSRKSPAPEGRSRRSPASEARIRRSPASEGRARRSPAPEARPRRSPAPEARSRKSPVPEGKITKTPLPNRKK